MESYTKQFEKYQSKIVTASAGDAYWPARGVIGSRLQDLRRSTVAHKQKYRTIGEHHKHIAQRQPYVSESNKAQRWWWVEDARIIFSFILKKTQWWLGLNRTLNLFSFLPFFSATPSFSYNICFLLTNMLTHEHMLMHAYNITFTMQNHSYHSFAKKQKTNSRRPYKTQATLQATVFGPNRQNRTVNWDRISQPNRDHAVAANRWTVYCNNTHSWHPVRSKLWTELRTVKVVPSSVHPPPIVFKRWVPTDAWAQLHQRYQWAANPWQCYVMLAKVKQSFRWTAAQSWPASKSNNFKHFVAEVSSLKMSIFNFPFLASSEIVPISIFR